ncbi:MAG: ribosomal protein L7/L12 [Bacteroidota bacterium]
MMDTAPERVVDLVREGRKIEAVKIVREETGASLKDALQAVDAIEAQARDEDGTDPMPEVEALALEGRTVEAIRLLRQRSGLGLKEAKDVVDALPQPAVAAQPRVFLVVAIALALLVMGVVMVFLAA